jgi:hypothetical protein
MTLWLEFGLNLMVTLLLAATLAYCMILNKRIRMLQNSRGELAELLKHFDESTARASESIVALQSASKRIGETIQARIEKAQYTMDDLEFLIERAGKAADGLQGHVAGRQAKQPPALEPRRAVQAAEQSPPSRPQARAREREEEAPLPASKSLASLQAMLEKVAKRGEEKEPPRSEVEKELLAMIKSSKS